uniref:Uncharacterized protein n=1 Tax=Vitis vinifera TaxID=29760 RepID=F6I1Z2_VITVI
MLLRHLLLPIPFFVEFLLLAFVYVVPASFSSAYVHCSFLWFPIIVNYLSLFVCSFGFS